MAHFFAEHECAKCSVEYGVYVKLGKNSSLVIICLYVDDLPVTGNDSIETERFKVLMKSEFEMIDLGKLT